MDTIEKDILGQALLDYYAGDQGAVIHVFSDISEREDLPVAHFFREWEQMPELEQKALNYCSGTILDLGAGAGSHSLVLQEKGFQVTACDQSDGACAVMRQRGINRVEQSNAFNLTGETYDTILMLMNGIGLVQDLNGLALFFESIKCRLKPGGKIIADSSDISYMYYDEEGAINLDLNAEYHGVVTYQMEYKLGIGEQFKWLFIDFGVLQDYAQDAGFICNLLAEGENYHYLVELKLA